MTAFAKLSGSVTDYFNNNPYSQNVGQAAGGVVGAVTQFAQLGQDVKAYKDTQYDIPTLMPQNPYERPEYNLGQAWAQNAAFDPEKAGKGMVGRAALAGAGAGSQIGSIAGPIGQIGGAIQGGILGAIGGIGAARKARRNAREAKTRELEQLQKAQTNYNEKLTGYDATMDARERYNKRLMNRRRRILTNIS